MTAGEGVQIRKSRILVVDDVEMNRDVLARQLRRMGHDPSIAENGRTALEAVRATPFDLVLLDIMMPEVDGYEVLRQLKEDPALRDIPVVMISAIGDTESVARCIELGAEDYLPKPFNPLILKARVNASLVKKRLHEQEKLYAESLARELEIGRRIQAGFLPDRLPERAGWEIAARFEPARQVAGDFYDAFELAGGAIAILVADVCDKGVGAALYMALFRSLLRAFATSAAGSGRPADELLVDTVSLTNDYIAETHGGANMFATLFFGILSPGNGDLLYVNRGHDAPLITSGGAVRRLPPTGAALGLFPGLPFSTGLDRLAPGETLLLFTDGVTEARGPDGAFGEERLLAAAAVNASASALLAALVDELHAHVAGAAPHDDVTLVAVRRN